MPKSTRTPISYRPQFADAMFRPRDVVEAELAGETPVDASQAPRARRTSTPKARPSERTVERSNDQPRLQIRHSFDVWQDQLTALAEIQTQRFSATGRKPKIGTLVQEALDAYIAAVNERTNERLHNRSRL